LLDIGHATFDECLYAGAIIDEIDDRTLLRRYIEVFKQKRKRTLAYRTTPDNKKPTAKRLFVQCLNSPKYIYSADVLVDP
jgi:hypothetical protein